MAAPVQDVAQLGIFRTKPLDDNGLFVYAWRRFFQTLELFRQNAPSYFFASHPSRTTTSPLNAGTGTIFYETDRTVSYIATPTSWLYLTGIYSDMHYIPQAGDVLGTEVFIVATRDGYSVPHCAVQCAALHCMAAFVAALVTG